MLSLPMKIIHHSKLPPKIFFSEVVQHSGVNKALHERGPVLRQPESRQPHVADPFMVHVAECQGHPRRFRGRGTRQ